MDPNTFSVLDNHHLDGRQRGFTTEVICLRMSVDSNDVTSTMFLSNHFPFCACFIVSGALFGLAG